MFPLMRRQDGGVPSQKRQSMRAQQVASARGNLGRAGLSAVLTAKARSAAVVALAKAERASLPVSGGTVAR